MLYVRTEVLNRVVPLGENHLRWLLSGFLAHYHGERHHQGLDSTLIDPDPTTTNNTRGRILCRPRLGGMLRHYYREAA